LKQERHIIRKQLIELELPSKEGAIALQRKVSRLYQEEVVKHLERVFDGLNLNGQILRIPKLEIDLGTISPEQIDRVFVEKCVQEIQKVVEAQAIDFQGEAVSDAVSFMEQDVVDVFLHFLEKGTLPWQANFQKTEQLETRLLEILSPERKVLQQKIIQLLQTEAVALQRLFKQCSLSFLKEMLHIIWTFSPTQQQQIEALLETWLERKLTAKEQRNLYFIFYKKMLKNKKVSTADVQQLEQKLLLKLPVNISKTAIQKIIAQQILTQQALEVDVLTPKIEKIIQENQVIDNQALDKPIENAELVENIAKKQFIETEESVPEQLEDAYFIENAGLVICAYFLTPLFKGFEWLEEGTFKSKALQERALHLTQYLVSGEENTAEFLLPLNKVLCGIPVNQSTSRHLQLSESEKEEAQNLLQHLIQHWTILGNTSVESLRHTFLQRRGKLIYEKAFSSWLLQVEKTGYDICVEKLPWTISVIKLPWMLERLQVEWV